VLANETNKPRIDSILDSFFAGCRKYDLYELAKKYYTINPNDLFQIQQAITSKEITREQMQYAINTIDGGNPTVAASNSGGGVTGSGGGGATGSVELNKYQQIAFYFGNDFPKQNKPIPNYAQEYDRYTSPTNVGLYTSKPNGAQLDEFFNTVVTPNYQIGQQLADKIAELLTTNTEPNTNITIVISSSCSAPATESYNKELSARRIASVIKFFTEYPATNKFVKSNRLILKSGEGFGENTTSQPKKSKKTQGPFSIDEMDVGNTVNCTDNDNNTVGGDTQAGSKDVFTTSAMACRRAFISSITTNITEPTPVLPPKKTTVVTGNVVTTTETQTTVETTVIPRDNITKRVLRALLSECDYFEVIKEETPMVYDNLKDKLKFFQPAFHSMTPEGLNTRLTFLQQCMRPGDTIPVVKSIGGKDVLEYNNATNTAFGAPPVLILRVGDFYNTKIIPTSLSIAYEGLDMNPEGIGVQPMIAKVTLAFNFVGGSGLKESVDRLQNALTFNYYANTEIYDDRADVTDTSYLVLDKEFLQFAALSGVAPPTINSAQPNNGLSNENTIGTILTNSISSTGQTGTISYESFMDKFSEETQNYFTNVVNKSEETVNQYNNALRQQWMLERNYTNGAFLVDKNEPVNLFGKPNNTEARVNVIVDELIKDIKNGDEGFLQLISSKDFSNKVMRQLKENYTNVVKTKGSTYLNAVTTITQSMTNVQQVYISYVARANTVMYYPSAYPGPSGTDGKQDKLGNVISYTTLPTTTVDPSSTGASDTLIEMANDILKIKHGIVEFNGLTTDETKFTFNGKEYSGKLIFPPTETKLPDDQKVFVPFNSDDFINVSFRRVYMILSDDVIDDKKYETFKNAMIGNIINNQGLIGNGESGTVLSEDFDKYWKGTAKPKFENENNTTKEFINYMKTQKLQNFLKFTPYTLKKKRLFDYTTENANTSGQIALIKGLGDTENQNTNKATWDDEISSEVFISKAKFN
jgi:hypothetical protein